MKPHVKRVILSLFFVKKKKKKIVNNIVSLYYGLLWIIDLSVFRSLD